MIELHRSRHDAFLALAAAQRRRPETMAVSQVCNPDLFNATGLFTYMDEHMGDLTHRMTEYGDERDFGFGSVGEKVRRGLRYLEDGPDVFARKAEVNVANNWSYARDYKQERRDLSAYTQAWTEAADRYVQAHEQLTTWNEAQEMALQCALATGRRQWGSLVGLLESLTMKLDAGPEEWTRWAGSFIQENGLVIPWTLHSDREAAPATCAMR